jgi:hypothetical protein
MAEAITGLQIKVREAWLADSQRLMQTRKSSNEFSYAAG